MVPWVPKWSPRVPKWPPAVPKWSLRGSPIKERLCPNSPFGCPNSPLLRCPNSPLLYPMAPYGAQMVPSDNVFSNIPTNIPPKGPHQNAATYILPKPLPKFLPKSRPGFVCQKKGACGGLSLLDHHSCWKKRVHTKPGGIVCIRAAPWPTTCFS